MRDPSTPQLVRLATRGKKDKPLTNRARAIKRIHRLGRLLGDFERDGIALSAFNWSSVRHALSECAPYSDLPMSCRLVVLSLQADRLNRLWDSRVRAAELTHIEK